MARLAAERACDEALLDELSPARGWQEHYRVLSARPDLSTLGRWATDDAEWWHRAAPAELLRDVRLDVPVLHIAGLSDFLLGGSLAADAAFRASVPDSSHLILGPWAHMPWNCGSAGPQAALSVDRATIAFFDHYLKGSGPKPSSLLCYDPTRERWDIASRWPTGTGARLYLHSSGLAAAHLGDGQLRGEVTAGSDRFVHDPTRPTPLIGGAAGTPPGPIDRAGLDNRADVATYDTEPFGADARLLGRTSLTLQIDADAARYVCAASLSLLKPDGQAAVLATSAALGAGASVQMDMGALSTTVPQGARLRLSVQGAADPAFAIPPDQAHRFDGASRPVTLNIHHAGSHLTLPPLLQEEPSV